MLRLQNLYQIFFLKDFSSRTGNDLLPRMKVSLPQNLESFKNQVDASILKEIINYRNLKINISSQTLQMLKLQLENIIQV